MALIFTSGKDLSEEDVAAFLRVLVSDTFAWEVKRHSSSEFKVLFPTKGDLAKMTRFNVEMKEGVTQISRIQGRCGIFRSCSASGVDESLKSSDNFKRVSGFVGFGNSFWSYSRCGHGDN